MSDGYTLYWAVYKKGHQKVGIDHALSMHWAESDARKAAAGRSDVAVKLVDALVRESRTEAPEPPVQAPARRSGRRAASA